jgi:hypothetical protein
MNDLKIINRERGLELIWYQHFTFYKEKHINNAYNYTCRGCFSKLYLNKCYTVNFRF